MAGYLELVEDFLIEPRAAADVVRRYKPLGIGFLSYAMTGLSIAVAHRLVRGAEFSIPLGIAVVLSCLWQILGGVASAAFFHMAAEVGGGEGSAEGLFVLFGMSSLVWTLILPAALIARALLWDGWFSSTVIFAALFSANFVLKARSLRDNYQMSSGTAWAVLVLPYVLAVLFIFAVALLLLAGAAVAFLHSLG